MSTEHTPFDATDQAALGFFFPEGDDAREPLDHETVLIVERRVRVMALYRRGSSMRAIAHEVGCSLGTVHADVHAVLKGYQRLATRDAREHRADALQRLHHREAEIAADLARSRAVAVDTTTARRVAGGAADSTVRRRQTYGDPRLHQLLLQCWLLRCKLLGLFQDADRTSPPPTKLVAGFDPADAV